MHNFSFLRRKPSFSLSHIAFVDVIVDRCRRGQVFAVGGRQVKQTWLARDGGNDQSSRARADSHRPLTHLNNRQPAVSLHANKHDANQPAFQRSYWYCAKSESIHPMQMRGCHLSMNRLKVKPRQPPAAPSKR
uniref:Uncharacterized protein n=1 Tax=Panagrellus redivivus TaxID=6233 RepID=A0A7E4UZX6_PANRE